MENSGLGLRKADTACFRTLMSRNVPEVTRFARGNLRDVSMVIVAAFIAANVAVYAQEKAVEK